MQQDQADIWKPSLIAGAVFGLLSGIPLVGALNCACCSLIVGAGVMASFMLIRASAVAVSYGRAALTGALAGLFAVPFWLLADVSFTVLRGRSVTQDFDDAMEQTRGMVEGGEWVVDAMAQLGAVGLLMITSVIFLFIWIPFGTLGGVLGRALFERRTTPPAIQPPPQGWTPPPPPPPADPGTTQPTFTS